MSELDAATAAADEPAAKRARVEGAQEPAATEAADAARGLYAAAAEAAAAPLENPYGSDAGKVSIQARPAHCTARHCH